MTHDTCSFFFFNDPATNEIYTRSLVGSVRCVKRQVFMLWLDLDEDKFIVDHKEVESVRWIDLEECIECVEKNLFRHYIATEELQILSKALEL